MNLCLLTRTRLALLASATIGLVALSPQAFAQDSIRDRLSPGNAADWADEPFAPTDGYYDGGGFDQGYGEGYDEGQAWYRDRDGRFYFEDSRGARIYQDQYDAQRNRRWSDRSAATQRSRQWSGRSAASPQRPRLGVVVRNAQDGVRVVEVRPNSAAARAGLQAGDVINEVNGNEDVSAQRLVREIRNVGQGEQLTMTITRDGQQREINANLDSGDTRYRAARPADRDNWQDMDRMRREVENLRREVERIGRNLDEIRRGTRSMQGNGDGLDESFRGDSERTARALEG